MKGLEAILQKSDNVLHGIPAAPGFFIGSVYKYEKEKIAVNGGAVADTTEALTNFREALAKSKHEMTKIFNLAKEKMGETRATIFEAQLMILDDPHLIDSIEKRIEDEKLVPEYIVNDVIGKYQEMMILSSEPYMKERAHDIEDIKNRIIRNLQKKRWKSKITTDVVVLSSTLTPADTILFSKSSVRGYITERGGLTSHAAIIARSLNIPAVVGVHEATDHIKKGDQVIVDGFYGYVFVNPTNTQLTFYREKIDHLEQINRKLEELKDKPAETTDGKRLQLQANVDVTDELALVQSHGANGIGLYRTEQLIEELGEFPDEEQQYKTYCQLSQRIYPDTAIIRAFDVGGDKVRLFTHEEANPFLGLRGIRFLLENDYLFRSQIRAILRASTNKNIKFMIPMISTILEIRETKKLIEICKDELRREGKSFDEKLPIGIMIEVPSAALMAGDFAEEADFLSIGTNDLIQYIMAVDRGNDLVQNLYQEFSPAVLRTLDYIVKRAKEKNVSVSICGEMAADNLAVPFLVGIGLDSLSVSPSMLYSIKRTIRSISYEKARELAEEMLQMRTEKETTDRMRRFFDEEHIERTRYIL